MKGCAAGMAFALLTGGWPAFAEAATDQPSQPPQRIEEIIVTAQKRQASLQDVPVAVSAFTDNQRDLLGIKSAQDLADFTPSMSYVDSPNRIMLRGVGRVTNSIGSDPGVATYYDGAYNSESWPLAQPPLLIDRIEILRGPQGTLYGRNSIGGAVNVISKRPADAFEAEFSQTISSRDSSRTTVTASSPIGDRVGFRLSGDYDRAPEYIRNVAGGDIGGSDRTYLEGQLDFSIGASAELWLLYGYMEEEGDVLPSVRRSPYDTTSLSSGLFINPTLGYTAINPGVDDHYSVAVDDVGTYDREEHRFVAEFIWHLDSSTIKYIGGYGKASVTISEIDFDQTTRASFVHPVTGTFVSSRLLNDIADDKRWWSNELNWSSSDDARLRWILGVYHYGEDDRQPFRIYNPGQAELATPLSMATFQVIPNPSRDIYFQDGDLESESYAVYGQADYDLTETWSATLGLRQTWDRKRAAESQRLVLYDPATFGLPFAIDAANSQRKLKDDWQGTTAVFGLQWKPDENRLAYASVSTGYKSGGFNLGSMQDPVDEEKITAFELGYKWTLQDRLRMNAAAFYYDYKDIQVLTNFCAAPDGTCGFSLQQYINVPKARSYGFELESTWHPADPVQLILSYAYLNAEFRQLDGVQNPLDPTGNPLDLAGTAMPLSPENKATAALVYTFNVGPGLLDLAASYTWTDEFHLDLFDFPLYRVEDHGQASFTATWTDHRDRYRLIGFVSNAFDKESFSNMMLELTGPGTYGRSVSTTLPRMVGAEVQLRF